MSGKKLPFGVRFGLAAASVALGIMLFLCTVVTLLIADIRIITSENNIRQITKLALGSPQQVHSTLHVSRGALGVPYAAGPHMEEDGADLNSGVTDGLVGFLYEGLKDYLGDQLTMTEEELESVVEQSTVKDFIADKAAGLVTDYIIGEVTTTISGEEIKQLLQENQTLIEKVTGQPLPTEMMEQIVQVVENNETVQKLEEKGLAGFIEELGGVIPEEGVGNAGGMEGLGGLAGLKPKDPNALGKEIFGDDMADSVANITNTLTGGELEGLGSISDVLTLFRAVTSVPKLLLGIGMCLVLIAAIIFVNIKQLGKGLRRSGYPLLIAGFGFLANLVALFVPSLFVMGPLPLGRQILVMIAGANGTAFGLGLALIIAGFVVGSLAKKNAAKAAQLAAVEAEIPVIEETPEEDSEEVPAEIEEEAPAEAAEEEPENCEENKEEETQEV